MKIVVLILALFSSAVFAKEPLKPFHLDKYWFIKNNQKIKITQPKIDPETLFTAEPEWCVTETSVNLDEPETFVDSAEEYHYTEIPKKIVTTQLQDGPPKWIPPELAYWDSSAGDWRFSKTNWEDDNKDIITPPDMIMFGFNYDNANKKFSFGANLNTKYWYGVFNPTPASTTSAP